MYAHGSGVPQNYFLAAKWYQRAAERGHGGAQLELGLLHNKGQGVPQDLVLAYMWLNLSASEAVGEDRDFKVRLRDAVATKMTVAQVALAQQMAQNWYKALGWYGNNKILGSSTRAVSIHFSPRAERRWAARQAQKQSHGGHIQLVERSKFMRSSVCLGTSAALWRHSAQKCR
jgi:hypothetical protein